MTDDQGYGDIGHHGNPWIKTPHLDKFADESLELTNFHVGTTCTPTRAGLMTGRNANRNNAWHTIAGCSILSEDEETIAEVFAKNGYQTAMFGKWHLGDNYPFRPHDRGFQTALYHGGGGIGQTPDHWGNDYFDDTYFRNGEPEKFEGYCTDVWFDETIAYLKDHSKKPFFIYLAPNAAHGPFNVPEKYAKLHANDPLTHGQKRFYGMINNIDENFGKLVAWLEDNNLADNTILIFTTDNGTANGISYLKKENKTLGYNAGLRGVKGSNYDGGHRVPFFIRWPEGGFVQKPSLNELVSHVDILPTLAAMTGLPYKPGASLDGTNVTGMLNGEIPSLDRMLVVDTQRKQWPEKGRNSCVMTTQWRLVNGSELYNTLEDPGQKNDLASEFPDQVSKMNEFYTTWWSDIASEAEYAYIPIGQDPVSLTIHDLHTEELLPWNQQQIREAKHNPNGYYTIDILEEGNYQFRMSRYPPESGLAINEEAKKIDPSPSRDGLPTGIGIEATTAIIKLNDETISIADIDPGQPYVVIEKELGKGQYKFSSTFLTADNTQYSVYYNIIEKL
ncbi:arylsulfatase [Fulvivirga sp. M361]|nr:arylsulfatase [Fulvivirga sp. M361]